jgi:hypothetical protein
MIELPDSRTSIRALTYEGEEIVLARAISRQLYRCPHCREALDVGADHVIVRYPQRPEAHRDHQHWHRDCVEEGLLLELRQVRRVPAGEVAAGVPLRGPRARRRRTR